MQPAAHHISVRVAKVLKNTPAAEVGKIPNQCGAYVIHAESARRCLSQEIARTQTWTFDRRLRIKTLADIDAAIPLVAQAFKSQSG